MNITSTSLKYVDHTYHDFSTYIIEGGELTKHKKSDNNFPARLHKLVSDGHSNDVITWMVSRCLLYIHISIFSLFIKPNFPPILIHFIFLSTNKNAQILNIEGSLFYFLFCFLCPIVLALIHSDDRNVVDSWSFSMLFVRACCPTSSECPSMF